MAQAAPTKAPTAAIPGIASLLLAVALSLTASGAMAGAVHPDLEARLAATPAGAFVPVIVELAVQGNPSAAAASAASSHRRARGRAVVEALRDVASRTQPPIQALLAREQAAGAARNVKSFWVFNGLAVNATEAVIRRLAARHDVRAVRLDTAIPPPVPKPTALSVSSAEPVWNIEMIRAPEVWAIDPRFTGDGIVVGSFDTGVDGAHPDLAARYRGNHAISWFDPYGEHAVPYDANGHGTHTTGTMLGGDLSGYSIGVAPGARWIAAKAWNDDGQGTESAFHQIFEWFLAPGGDPANAPDVVNSSWGLIPALCFTEFRANVQAFRAAGIVPVFASGNEGPDPGTVLAPGSYAESFTVGATDFLDEIAFFSSQGPSSCDGAVKPNISAPGVFILSTFPGGDYAYLDGTSMATPHVSGAAAVLLAIAPDLSVEEVEAILVSGAVELGPAGPDNAFGYGRLDLMESARIALESSGASVVGVTAAPATALEAGTVAGGFRIRRSGSTEAALSVTYTVSGSAIAGSDYVALPGSVTLEAGVASVDIAVTPIDDTLGELDETVVVRLDANPAYIAAPALASVTIVSDETPPDLAVAALGAPASAGAGDAITLTDTTRNIGTSPATPSATVFFLSTDAALDAADARLASRAVPALAAGAADSGSIVATIPAGTAPGTYYLFAKADGDDALLETNEENNLLARGIQVGPDLTVWSMSVPTNGGAGLPITVSDTVKNQGAGLAAASTTTFYVSADWALDAADVAIGSRAVPALAAGASDTGSIAATLPAGLAPGIYYVFARADAADAVAELYETNNTMYQTLRVGPDLTVSNLVVPAMGGAGATLSVTDTVSNTGAGAAAASVTRFYLSANSVLEPGDASLGARAVPVLAPGASNTGSATLSIPPDTAGGAYYVIAVADGDASVSETQETNNTLLRTIQVGADLTVWNLTVPADAGAGLPITLTDTVKNQGAGVAAASTTTFHLSLDWILDAGDIALGSRPVPALAAGALDTGSVTLTIPAGTAAGMYYLFARADGGNAVAEIYETNNAMYRTVRVGPDLTVASLTAPAAGGAGAAITLTDVTRNTGAGAAPSSSTRFYLSANSTLDAADVLLGARAIAALAAGAADTGSVSVTIPAEVAGGSYYLLAVADAAGAIAETQENNNILLRTIQVGADLTVWSMTVPADGGAGQAIVIGDTIRNQGAGAAGASTTTFYLSADWTLDTADVALGSRAVPAIAAGASDTGSIAVTLPADTATGTYYLFARADAANAVAELYETNNTMYRTVRVGPDLTVASLTSPGTAGAGTSITVADTIRNQGAGAAAASTTRFYLSANSILEAGDVLLGARAVPALAPGASSTGSVTLGIPAETAGGAYYLVVVADGDGIVAESQENNNALLRTIQVGTDLTVTAMTAPADAGAGQPVTLGDTTRNQGAGVAGASTTVFYLSSDWIYDAADIAIGSRAVPALAPGASDSGSITATIPAGTATGTYYVLARADGANAVAELSEFNNTMYRTLRVGPDLSIASVTAPAAAGAGGAITLTDTTRNIGVGAAGASTTRFYLSANGTLDAGDAFLGMRAVPALAGGASDTGSITLTIPAGIAAGAYYVMAIADGEAAVAETYESNNVLLRAIQVGADLTVWTMTLPAEGAAGQAITLGDTIKNQGAETAAATTTTFYLSTDWTLDAADVVLGSRAVAPIGAGAFDSGSVSVTLPAGLAAGTYYVFARADAGNVVGEIYETNNTTQRTLRIVP